jgi:hypothetical protein
MANLHLQHIDFDTGLIGIRLSENSLWVFLPLVSCLPLPIFVTLPYRKLNCVINFEKKNPFCVHNINIIFLSGEKHKNQSIVKIYFEKMKIYGNRHSAVCIVLISYMRVFENYCQVNGKSYCVLFLHVLHMQ